MTISSYYLWKWADNDLAGRPGEVFSELICGRMHPALEPFDARPLLNELEAIALRRQALGEEWDWQVYRGDSPDRASFVFLRCPAIPKYGAFRKQFVDLVYPHRLSGFSEEHGSIMKCMLPKLNSFEFGEDPDGELFDIATEDIPLLLGRLHHEQTNPYVVLTNRMNHFVQCIAHRNGFCVEWRENHSFTDFTDYDHWRAGCIQARNSRRGSRTVLESRCIDSELQAVKIEEFRHERLRFGDALRIFQAFLRGEPRPVQYHWRSIRADLEQAKQ
ncbi:MAG: hypothetical protein PHW60_16680 [Kiritimatiellae bacterium]|nr:hypothetical protein [Kiritimatiellia bacterium]